MKTDPGSPAPARWPALSLFIAAASVSSLFLAWRLLASVDYLYPALYEPIGIGAHIDRFGPENRYRAGFEQTARPERQRLFAAIGRAIRDQGRGLESLSYHDPAGKRLGSLLRPPEITHLRDVARLVGMLEKAGLAALVILILQIVVLDRRRRTLPKPGRMLLLTGAGFGVAVLAVIAIGPKAVFYAMHDWVFPAENQWFFFYQDSLMSTMMKAPDFFGYVAVAMTMMAVALLWLILFAASRLSHRRTQAR